jgi:carbamoyltransferase
LEHAKIAIQDVDYVVFYDKSFLSFDRLLMTYLTIAPKGLLSWLEAMPSWLGQKLHIPKPKLIDFGHKKPTRSG